MFCLIPVLLVAFSYAIHVSGRIFARPPAPTPPDLPASPAELTTIGTFTFSQLIDHDDPNLGTFAQQVWWSDQFWAGPGSPVVLFTPGEIAAAGYTGYLTNRTITGLYAQALGGAVVMIEHRFWGNSSPYQDLTTKNLQYLTLKQAISDLTYFADNVQFPFDPENRSRACDAPWVLSGGSYSGALAAWTASTAPGTFWAYHASSAPVEAIFDYWQYFQPVKEGMPKNCSKDVSLVIKHLDKVMKHRNASEQMALKSMFGLESLQNDDFAEALATGPYLWQSNTFYTNYSGFYQFCDAVENAAAGAAVTPNAEGVGLGKALAGYANWIKNELPGTCQYYGYTNVNDLSCLDSHNASNLLFTDRTVGNAADRQWIWMLCNEPFSYWQDGAPLGTQTIVSRLVNSTYFQRQCDLYFPPEGEYTYGSNRGSTVEDLNFETKGWFPMNTTRLIWTNGEFDPWRTSGLSSIFRPGGQMQSTPEAPIQIIPGGFHCSDLIAKDGLFNNGVKEVIDNEIAQIKAWVDEYYQ